MIENIVINVVHDEAMRFVFLQRIDGTWTFPSGKASFGESFEQAARRETQEETNLEAQVLRSFGNRQVGDRFLHYFLSKAESSTTKLMEPDKFQRIEWYSGSEIIQLTESQLFYPIKEYLKDLKYN